MTHKLNNLRKACIDRELSQLELSRMLDISPSQLSMIICGWRRPNDDVRRRIVEVFQDTNVLVEV